MQQPTIKTSRLILRPFSLEDAANVQRLAGAIEIARVTLNVPHPYEDGMAQAWIAGHAGEFENGRHACFAVASQESGQLMGCVGLGVQPQHARAELGY